MFGFINLVLRTRGEEGSWKWLLIGQTFSVCQSCHPKVHAHVCFHIQGDMELQSVGSEVRFLSPDPDVTSVSPGLIAAFSFLSCKTGMIMDQLCSCISNLQLAWVPYNGYLSPTKAFHPKYGADQTQSKPRASRLSYFWTKQLEKVASSSFSFICIIINLRRRYTKSQSNLTNL